MSRLTYRSYLRVDELLGLQCPRSAPMVPDELLFITVHQVFELWLKVLLFELTLARDDMLAGQVAPARARLQRCCGIERVLLEQFDVLDSMAAAEFERFRDALGTASGAQSAQFLEVEFLSGLKDPCFAERRDWLTPAEHEVLRRRLAEPCLWTGFLTVLGDAGFDVSTRSRRASAYRTIARNRVGHAALWDLQDALLRHDQSWSLWRARHALTVERQIGAQAGTGGSAGATHLRARFGLRFYPELWELPSSL
ncbi:MAG TPA: tryptophan 2,3-dioxygenase family protein [Pseudonocardiaceae bacterium]